MEHIKTTLYTILALLTVALVTLYLIYVGGEPSRASWTPPNSAPPDNIAVSLLLPGPDWKGPTQPPMKK